VERFYKLVTQTKDHKTIIAVDVGNEESIMSYLRSPLRHKSKFIDIAKIVLGRLHNRELYKREKIDGEHNNVYAMRFFVGQENDRIYCQEIYTGDVKTIVMGVLHLHKETRENSPKEIAIIKTVSKYEYKKNIETKSTQKHSKNKDKKHGKKNRDKKEKKH
jgi:hypothetical protein